MYFASGFLSVLMLSRVSVLCCTYRPNTEMNLVLYINKIKNVNGT